MTGGHMPFRVLLADDHDWFRRSAKAMLEHRGYAVVGEAANGYEAVQLARQLHPEVALVDLRMPVLSGLEATRRILETSWTTRVIAITAHQEESYVLSALRAGVRGYILKARLADDLDQAIDEVFHGRIWISSGVRYPDVEKWIDGVNLGC